MTILHNNKLTAVQK
uniref:Uncharacterized protein n=1 Tax=Anguilla anguilla TaxID=7936 RepID=A0A0E9UXZ1_ANGAN